MITIEQRQELIRILSTGEEISPEWGRVLFPPEKREYELVYYGKEREEDVIANTLAVPLQAIRTFGNNDADWHNMLILGDNLQVLKRLLELKKQGKLINSDGSNGVRLVYIDPPFATKKDFQNVDGEKAYQDKVAGAQFVEFLRKRLILLRELLADNGSIYLHLDTKKVHYIKVIMDEIFGESNFQNEIIWKRTSSHSDTKTYAKIHDSILFYSKNKAMLFNSQYSEYSQEHLDKRYKHADPDGRRFTDDNLDATGLKGGGYVYEWKGITKTWRCPIVTMNDLEQKNRIYYTRNGVARIKRYLDEVQGQPTSDLWQDVNPVNSQAAERVNYPTQKPEQLLNLIINASTNHGDIVLDAFAGSGTTLAVAEKNNRRWIGIDCGKLAIYSIQKRMLRLHSEIGNKGKTLIARAFTLYNAGLYDFSKLKELSWEDWRFFALQLFQCRDERHRIGGIEFDGYRQGSSVLIFNHKKHPDAPITEDTIYEIHEAVGSKISSKVFIVAPALSFDFQQDYIDLGDIRYYALRIPYSIIHELHRREFTALKQPADEIAVNDTVEAVGFDFIRTPELQYETGKENTPHDASLYIKINVFNSDAIIRQPYQKKENLETLSMVMMDFNYDDMTKIFNIDRIYYADVIEKEDWKVKFPLTVVGDKVMAVFVDIYGNEARVLINIEEFAIEKKVVRARRSKKK